MTAEPTASGPAASRPVAQPPPPAVVCRGVGKVFGKTYAVRDVDLEIPAGAVHALVGENGAGKSTLLGMISGRLAADTGSVEVFDTVLGAGGPRKARGLGLVTVYQELTMVPALSAEANVFLGGQLTRHGLLSRREMRRRYERMCADFEVSIPADALARTLSVSQQQILEIMRGVQADGRVLLLDEPSAALAEHERDILYRILDRLRSRGTTIVFVSHNLEEVLRLSDTISVLRNGRLVETAPRERWNRQALIRSMVGREIGVTARGGTHEPGGPALEASGVTVPGIVDDIGVRVHQGEIVGLWGLVGSGRTTFMRALAGLDRTSSGELRLGGEPVPWPRSARDAIRSGVVMVPEDRKNGLVPGMDAVGNVSVGVTRPTRLGRIDRGRERAEAEEFTRYFGFAADRLDAPVRHLSGGNQQKVLLAKWAARTPRVFLIDEPTRGIDVGAKSEVLASLVSLARDGAAVIVTSSELEEVLAIANRLLVFAKGRVVGEIPADSPRFRVRDIVRLGFHEKETDR
ncbi:MULTISPECIES: sugar ABC transporter ATP-binding protein [unclassified Streptomyces]|uniref:sugar ABC transporter ATP-binding protein n=1 Tax=unclassified Streptomyces TaxID=2593676 RepID=UPI002E2D2F32|nr:sugar ABC transporter ATP-binding protein [Streptomyces sp. NBC_01429]